MFTVASGINRMDLFTNTTVIFRTYEWFFDMNFDYDAYLSYFYTTEKKRNSPPSLSRRPLLAESIICTHAHSSTNMTNTRNSDAHFNRGIFYNYLIFHFPFSPLDGAVLNYSSALCS